MSIPSQLVQIPLAAGLNQKMDERAMQAPSLAICKDAQFDEAGGLQTRFPFFSLGLLDTDDNVITDFRSLAVYGNELLLFTQDNIYSRLTTSTRWVLRSSHPAVSTTEAVVFADNNDLGYGDRAELSGVILYAAVVGIGVSSSTSVYAVDKDTGSTLVGLVGFSGYARPRFVVVGTRILMFLWQVSTTTLKVYSIDVTSKASITTSLGTSVTVSATCSGPYDVAVQGGATPTAVGAMVNTTTTAYTAFAVTSALVVTTASKARTSNGVVGVCGAAGSMLVVYCNNTSVVADQLHPTTLADQRAGDAIYNDGLQPTSITACLAAVTNGWDIWTSVSLNQVKRSGIDSNGVVTPVAMRAAWAELASRAFAPQYPLSTTYSYAWITSNFNGTGYGYLQGTYFLMRSDGLIVGKSRTGNARFLSSYVTGFLPSAQPTSKLNEFAWLGVYARTLTGAGSVSLQGNGVPRDMIVTLDSNLARRCVQFGATLYISGSLPLQYDGVSITETGALIAPALIPFSETATGTGPPNGTYAYKETTRWTNAKGEVDRSSSFGVATVIVAANHVVSDGGITPEIWWTRKNYRTREVWRTTVNPTADTAFYLVSSQNTTQMLNPNRYLADTKGFVNSYLSTFTDTAQDASITSNETHPETGDQLENLSPPPYTLALATASRMFIAGIAGSPNQVWYSKYREVGKIAAFNDALTIDVPAAGGAITAMASLNGALIVFRERAVYAFTGDGYDNTGGGVNFSPGQIVSVDVGAQSQEATAVTDDGIMFRSSKGWNLLDRGLSVHYIGAAVDDYDGEAVLAAQLVPGQHQLRVTMAARTLVLDTLANQWGEWSVNDGISACVWQGQHVYLSSANGPMKQRTDYTGVTYGMDIETAWIKLSDLQGHGRVRGALILGEYRSAHKLRVRMARDYEYSAIGVVGYYDDVAWTVTPTVVGSSEQVKHGPSRQQCQAVKIRITAVNTDGVSVPTGEALKLTGLALEVGVHPTLNTRLAAAQKD